MVVCFIFARIGVGGAFLMFGSSVFLYLLVVHSPFFIVDLSGQCKTAYSHCLVYCNAAILTQQYMFTISEIKMIKQSP